jgi:pimeloyl-ACP methyl ester carboxylesterase
MRRLFWAVLMAATMAAPMRAATVDGLTIHSSSTGTIEETGHFLMMEKPEEFNRVLSAFLERIRL